MTWNEAVPSAEQQRELKREALLKQSARAFRANGYHATSLADIAKSLGISKPTLYYYVKNKQDLLYQCHLAASEQAFSAVCYDTSKNALERLCTTIENYVFSMIEDGSLSVIILEEKSLNPEQLADVIARRDKFQTSVIEIITQGVSDGSIIKCEPKFAAFSVLGTANWVTKWFRHNGPWQINDVKNAIVDFIRAAMDNRKENIGRTALWGGEGNTNDTR